MPRLTSIPSTDVDRQAYLGLLELNHAPVYAYPWYLDALGIPWHLLVLDNYMAVMPIYPKWKWGFKYLPMPFFVQQFGLFEKKALSDESILQFAVYLKKNYRIIEYAFCNNHASMHLASKFPIEQKINYELDLSLLNDKTYNDQTKRNLKTALKNNISIDFIKDPFLLINLFKQYVADKVDALETKDYQRLYHLMKRLTETGRGCIYGAFNDFGELLAASFFIKTENRIVNLFPASSENGRKLQAMTLILDHVIHLYAGQSIVLDFEGSMIESIARFYSGFGAEPHYYFRAKYNNLPSVIRRFKKI